MKAPKGMTGIFNDLVKNRQGRTNASKKFVVIGLAKSGTPYKITAQDIAYCGTATHEEAELKRVGMEQLNPGKRYVIQPL